MAAPQPQTRWAPSLLHVVLPMVLAGLVYVLWRPPCLLMFRWFEAAGMSEAVAEARRQATTLGGLVPAWVRYSLPDAVWAYSFGFALALPWRGVSRRLASALASAGPALAIGGELAQAVSLLPGTFDGTDLALCSGATALLFTSLHSRRGGGCHAGH